MKIRRLLAMLLIFALCISCTNYETKAAVKLTGKTKTVAYKNTPFGKHGKLRVKKTNLVDAKGRKFQIKGVSSHGINWDVGYPFINKKSLQNLRDEWGVNCIRLAMYTEEYNGYCVTDGNGRKNLLATIDTGVKAAKQLGMYVIIDWHILNDQTPKRHEKEAIKFFKYVSKKYKKYGNVLFEICNEPNGGTTWSEIKSYAKKAIKAIRRYNKKAIIIVGTPTWSQDVDIAAQAPIKKQKNIMYSFHFYAATHGDYNRQKIEVALSKKLPLICTEFSACDASGNGNYDFASANKWMSLLRKNNIGYCCWSLSNKAESASLLKAGLQKTSGYKTKDISKVAKWLIAQNKQL